MTKWRIQLEMRGLFRQLMQHEWTHIAIGGYECDVHRSGLKESPESALCIFSGFEPETAKGAQISDCGEGYDKTFALQHMFHSLYLN